jgi:hypothetical protein
VSRIIMPHSKPNVTWAFPESSETRIKQKYKFVELL